MFDVLITGAQVVTAAGTASVDIGISDGRIASLHVAGAATTAAGRTIDATGKLVLPGGIDPHCHIGIPLPRRETGLDRYTSESPEDATRAAAFGGVTTVVDFVMPTSRPFVIDGRTVQGSDATLLELAEVRRQAFSGSAHVDYTFHCMVSGANAAVATGQLGELISDGIASIKVFTVNEPMRVKTGDLWAVFLETAKHGGIMSVHAEDHDLVDHMRRRLAAEGNDDAVNLPLVHSKLSEELAFRHVLRLAERTETAVYMLHVSAIEGIEAVSESRSRNLPVYGETLHNYLEFNCGHYSAPEGTAAHTYPSLKYEADRLALVEAMLDGSLSTTATDHIATSREVKLHGGSVTTVCGGHNGIETRLPVTFTRLVQERRMSLERFAEVSATNAAKILGLYPRKGVIQPGSDADIVIWDPDITRTITAEGSHGGADYSIWDGFECRGYPVTTMLRGKVIVDDGVLHGDVRDGEWVRQRVGRDVLTRTAL
ncbi:MAG: amidohydrolase family protein [Microbacterium sp.]